MDTNIPKPALALLDFIGSIEAPHGYDTVYGNNQDKLAKPLTSMTIDQVISAGSSWSKMFGSSAAGKLQFMRATLVRLKSKLKLSGTELLNGGMQDRLGYQLLIERGYSDFMAGKIGPTAFGKALAQEWASFPVLAATKGATRQLKRGQSYYAGDGLNKSLVTPERVEAMLAQLLAMVAAPAGKPASTQAPAPAAPQPAPPSKPLPPPSLPIPGAPEPPAKKTWLQGVLAALGIGIGAGGAGWHFGAWLLFGVLGLALIIAVAFWIHGRNKP
jgi:muramidase (phage lysozyme)